MDDTTLSEWLRLREAADARSRSDELAQSVIGRLPRNQTISVLDLATGAGSNLRYLAERMPSSQRWLLIDRSEQLLRDLQSRTRGWAQGRGFQFHTSGPETSSFTIASPPLSLHVELCAQDLAGLNHPALFEGRHLVTASALLDLVSEQWLRSLAAQCRRASAAALITITYDGRFTCTPEEPEDELVRRAMNEHQRRDKGLGGPAAGPDAITCAERCFAAEGFTVATASSDWILGPGHPEMQRTLIEGWASAATEVMPSQAAAIASWRARRLAHVDSGQSHVVVGHQDLAAWLP